MVLQSESFFDKPTTQADLTKEDIEWANSVVDEYEEERDLIMIKLLILLKKVPTGLEKLNTSSTER